MRFAERLPRVVVPFDAQHHVVQAAPVQPGPEDWMAPAPQVSWEGSVCSKGSPSQFRYPRQTFQSTETVLVAEAPTQVRAFPEPRRVWATEYLRRRQAYYPVRGTMYRPAGESRRRRWVRDVLW